MPYIFIFFVTVGVLSCQNTYTPKPKGYIRIDFPEKEYTAYTSNCPFVFEYPKYGKVINDTDKMAEPCWMNLEFANYKCKIHLSYKKVNNNVSGYIEDCHKMAYDHAFKADNIREELISDPQRKVYGLLYDIDGNTASSVQFYLTDSMRHFMRGALYFETVPNKDSLAPAIAFFRRDIIHFIESLHWKN
jgi:gliding motility-associated lipoprotein GldD